MMRLAAVHHGFALPRPGRGAAAAALALLASLCVAWPTAAGAQAAAPSTAATPAPTPTVDEVVAAHIAARGGADRLHALRSMRASGLMKSGPGRVAPVVREIERPGRIRLEMTYQGMSSVYAHDGTIGWRVAPHEGVFEPIQLPPEVTAPSVDQLDIEGPLLDWRTKGHVVTLAGRTDVAGRPAWDLEIKLAGGTVRHDLVDAETFLVVRSDVERVISGRRTRMTTSFSDYREVGGLRFPHKIEIQVSGRPDRQEFVVQSVELDVDIDDSRFQLPK
jgi:hypothetical protein